MDAQFWINAWNEGRTAFHRLQYHEKLLKYFPGLNPKKDEKVLVPLCGKTKDMLWLASLGLKVHGVELVRQAVEAFFKENELSGVKISRDEHYEHFIHDNMTISCGDFFLLSADQTYDWVYDRASLVALPEAMRGRYAQVLKRALRIGGKCLLIVYEYDPLKMEGPPFSITDEEIHRLYDDSFRVQLLEVKSPSDEGARLASLGTTLNQKVYLLEKVR